MKFEWALLAEGTTQDARGAKTIVGVGQNIAIAPQLPATVRRVVVAQISDGPKDLQPGGQIDFSLAINSPTGESLETNSADANIGILAWPDVPAVLLFTVETEFKVDTYGPLSITLSFKMDAETATSTEITMQVVKPLQQ